jgi:hypothetical protein
MSIDIAAPGGSQGALTDALRADLLYSITNDQTGTSYTLVASDTCKVVTLSNAAAIALTLPNSLPVGFNCTVYQKGAGQVTFTAASQATIRNRLGDSKTAGQYALCGLTVTDNSDGSHAVYALGGDTAP